VEPSDNEADSYPPSEKGDSSDGETTDREGELAGSSQEAAASPSQRKRQ